MRGRGPAHPRHAALVHPPSSPRRGGRAAPGLPGGEGPEKDGAVMMSWALFHSSQRPPEVTVAELDGTASDPITDTPPREGGSPSGSPSAAPEEGAQNSWMAGAYEKLHASLNDAVEDAARFMDGHMPRRPRRTVADVEEESRLAGDPIDPISTPRAEWQPSSGERAKWDVTEYTHIGANLYELRRQVEAAMQWATPGAYPELHNTLTSVYSDWDLVEESAFKVALAAPQRDASPDTPGNGFRSILWVVDVSVTKLVRWLRAAGATQRKLIFPSAYYTPHIKEYAVIFHTLRRLLQYAVVQGAMTHRTALFLPRSERAMEIETIEEISQFDCSCFYGRKVAFYHLPPLRMAFHLIVSAMAGYGEGFYNDEGDATPAQGASPPPSVESPRAAAAAEASEPAGNGKKDAAASALTPATELLAGARSVMHGMHCFLSHTQRAESVVKRFRTCNIPFAKGFWNLTETAPMAGSTGAVVGPWMAVNQELKVPITEAALLLRFDDGPAAPHLHRALTCDAQQVAEVEAELRDLDGPGTNGSNRLFCKVEREQLERILSMRKKALRNGGRKRERRKEEPTIVVREEPPATPVTHVPPPQDSFNSTQSLSPQQIEDDSWVAEIKRRLAAFGGSIEEEQELGYVKTQLLAYTGPAAAGGGDRRGLIVHIHGGGFVAQSPRSHESYLRWWTKHLGVPILSIDYSLAPEAWFPRAVDECYHVYSWALENRELLGAGKKGRVILTGDSAGGNLAVAVTLKAIMKGDRRPDGVVCSYPVLNVKLAASPSRMLALMDALLPLGLLECCLDAYVGNRVEAVDDPLFSPIAASDALLKQLPPIRVLACELDPLLDDSVVFVGRLLRLGLDASIEVIPCMPHGFLNLAYLGGGDEALAASGRVVHYLRELLGHPSSFDDAEDERQVALPATVYAPATLAPAAAQGTHFDPAPSAT
eukprot:TRINITY_DN15362_c0_g2_i2.p1 TRINITY_DN15362_c0_g2~~TRINITY_DN15362_c0_g2_i2.p1  ORF type:complete len:938 (+),score=326.71 TRINITY_DN15362_c0_g2_i2:51-2864(+)